MRLQAYAPARVAKTITDSQFCVVSAVRPIHWLQEEVLEEDQIMRLIGPRALEGGAAIPKPFRPAVTDAEAQL